MADAQVWAAWVQAVDDLVWLRTLAAAPRGQWVRAAGRPDVQR